jgi:hypothetical protein
MTEKIKKVLDRVYEFDFKNSELTDGNEIIATETASEFVMTFRKRDLDRGIIVTPSGYKKGLVYKSTNGGEFYNNPSWIPDIVNFSLNVYGLKKGHFYKLTVTARDTGSNTVITNDRSLTVSNEEKELLIDERLTGVKENREHHAIFRSIDNEANLLFRIGKIYINNITIDEIELVGDEQEQKQEVEASSSDFHDGKIRTVAYGIFTTEGTTDTEYKGRYVPMTRYSGKGISLYLDKTTNEYVIERDNEQDTIGESFTNINYSVDINLNKVVNKGLFSHYDITEVSAEASPNTLKQGFIKFEFVDISGKVVHYGNRNSRILITINKIF